MANQNDILRALSTKEEAASPASLAAELRADEATVRTDLNRLKKKGYVDGGGSQWYINDAGREALGRVEEVSVTKEDVGEDELSKFRYYGELSGVPPEKVTACIELFQNTDMRSMEEMERVLAEMNTPQNQQVQWKNLYRGYLRNTTAPERREELYPLPKPEEITTREEGPLGAGEPGRGDRMDYIVEDNNVLRVGEGLGMFTFRQALQVVVAKRGSGSGGSMGFKDFADAVKTLNPAQPLTAQDLLDLANSLNEARGAGGNPPQPPPGYYVDGEGNLQELKPGQPIVVKQVTREPGKTYILNSAGQLEEHEPGKPIIIQMQPTPGSNMPPMVPFPVMGSDGEPVYDKDGKPVYANLEPMMKYMGFQNEQRRADERHSMLMGVGQQVRENIPDGIKAILEATQEARDERKTGSGSKQAAAPQQFKCGDCGTQFGPPEGWLEQPLICPNPSCGREYSKQELLG